MKRKTKIPKRLKLPPHPDAAAREYHRNLRKYAEKYIALMRAELKSVVPDLKETAADEQPEVTEIVKIEHNDSVHFVRKRIRMDANIEKKVRDIIEFVEGEMLRLFPDSKLKRWAWYMIDHTNELHKKGFTRFTKQVGMDMSSIMHDRELTPFFQNIVDENVGLIRSISQSHQPALKNGLVSLITSDAPSAQIAKMIRENFQSTSAKARFIARDQVGKLNGRINQYRQEQLGGTRYRWKGSKDERERDDHWKLEGTTQRWDKPPIVDRRTGRRAHPGGDFQCRCRAEMVLEDVLE